MTGRHSPGRRRRRFIRTGIATAAALAVAGGAVPFLLQGAQAEAAPVTVDAPDRYLPRGNALYAAGPDGQLERTEPDGSGTGLGRYRWVPTDGDPVDLGSQAQAEAGAVTGAGSNTVGIYDEAARTVTLKDLKAGTSTEITVPEGQKYLGTYGTAVLTGVWAAGAERGELHILRADGSGTTDTPVAGLDAGAIAGHTVQGGDARTLAVHYFVEGRGSSLGLLDLESAQITASLGGVSVDGDSMAVFSPDRIAFYNDDMYGVRVWDRSDVAKEPVYVKVGMSAFGDTEETKGKPVIGLSGDHVLLTRKPVWVPESDIRVRLGNPLYAYPLDGGERSTVLPHAQSRIVQAPGGGAVVTGGTGAADWAVRKVAPGADGAPAVTAVHGVPAKAGTVASLSLAAGRLTTAEPDSRALPAVAQRGGITVGTTSSTGTWRAVAEPDGSDAAQFKRYADVRPVGTGDGRSVVLADNAGNDVLESADADGKVTDLTKLTGAPYGPWGDGSRVLSASGRYVVYGRPGAEEDKYLVDQDDPSYRVLEGMTGAAVWGTALWTVDGAGNLEGTGLPTASGTATVSACAAKDLQAVGRWVYWECSSTFETDPVGVYDAVTGTRMTLPRPGKLGDGYVVSYDSATRRVEVTDFHTGTVAEPRTVEELPADPGAKDPVSADPYGGTFAYAVGGGQVRVADSGVPTSPVKKIQSRVEWSVDVSANSMDRTWSASWLLSKPVTGAKAEIRDKAGRVVRTLTPTRRDASLATTWDGKVSDTRYATDGTYTWRLTGTPADGQGPALSATGTFTLTGGTRPYHDLNGGAGDLTTLTSSGYLTTHYGDGKGAFGSKASGSGWPTGTVAVPFGDLTKDRCNDLLVRMPDGTLRRYTGKCAGGGYSPSGSYTALGTGWQQYNVLTAPGDITGDGRTDLIARQASTGDIYLFADNGSGGFKSRVKIRSAWTYTHITGAGDLGGDGFGDLLARRSDGTLFRYDGTGAGQFKERVTVFTSWGRTYNAMVGVGDITGDGRGDLVVRDTSGNLYRNNGRGNGSFTSRTQIATGWQGYKGLF
ncbi:FG-GAP-like repeat-containing protein [Streptomyces viridochromogenes]|uniref:FG-GAP-like repeat-containing protein n=1 Tax=Streptomyces viridochromogenes TaxID=1938 RepID=UPI00069CD4A5|nr:FG-GAP-like repeat-containing protein [Streptomyces viridochromogenes]